ncbi:hypothetical protein CBM2587_B60189 [Cupriavidus taiwanensis]|uniref:Uncharacterized protein n=1 Tax=Cupriavidus taiwanensis TaxID=164546 RepID=A0A375C5S5_9BURK|nr:hypothetical protein CBM2587_B60189 [Cupriavidus taiwanensis]
MAGLRAMAQSCGVKVARQQWRGFRIFTITVYLYSIRDKARGNGGGWLQRHKVMFRRRAGAPLHVCLWSQKLFCTIISRNDSV